LAEIFLVSNSQYLPNAADALRRRGHILSIWPVSGFADAGLREDIRQTIKSSELYIAIIDRETGLEGIPQRAKYRSIEEATRVAWQSGMPTLLFLSSEHAPRRSLLGVQTGFITEVVLRQRVDYFESLRDLDVKLNAALRDWEAGIPQPPPSPDALAPVQAPFVLPAHIDAFELAWYLTVDRKAVHVLLRQMDPNLLASAVLAWENENPEATSAASMGGSTMVPLDRLCTLALTHLRRKHAGHAPNPLWLAWMHATQSHLLHGLSTDSSGEGPVESASSSAS
jgi:hypothetical protein